MLSARHSSWLFLHRLPDLSGDNVSNFGDDDEEPAMVEDIPRKRARSQDLKPQAAINGLASWAITLASKPAPLDCHGERRFKPLRVGIKRASHQQWLPSCARRHTTGAGRL